MPSTAHGPRRDDDADDSRLVLAIETSNPSAASAPDQPGPGPGPGVALVRVPARPDPRAPISLAALAVERLPPHSSTAAPHHRASGDDFLMPAIDRLLATARRETPGLRATNIDRIAVSAGPGGYTGTRVACAVGKFLAEAINSRRAIPCMCVRVPSHFGPVRNRIKELEMGNQETTGFGVVALASKDDTAWFSNPLGGGCSTWNTPSANMPKFGEVLGAGEIPALAEAGVVEILADRFFPASLKNAAESAGIRLREPVFDPVDVAEVSCFLPEIDAAELNPIYPREPDAVTLWRARARDKSS